VADKLTADQIRLLDTVNKALDVGSKRIQQLLLKMKKNPPQAAGTPPGR
jgi:hypothetical protein